MTDFIQHHSWLLAISGYVLLGFTWVLIFLVRSRRNEERNPLGDYQRRSLVTEVKVKHVQVPLELYTTALKFHITSGKIIEKIRRQVFEGEKFDPAKEFDTLGEVTLYELKSKAFRPDKRRKSPAELLINPRMFNGLSGTISESTRMAEILYKKSGLMGVVPVKGLKKRTAAILGDMHSFLSILIDEHGFDWAKDILEPNNKKLEKRCREKSCQTLRKVEDELDKEFINSMPLNEKKIKEATRPRIPQPKPEKRGRVIPKRKKR